MCDTHFNLILRSFSGNWKNICSVPLIWVCLDWTNIHIKVMILFALHQSLACMLEAAVLKIQVLLSLQDPCYIFLCSELKVFKTPLFFQWKLIHILINVLPYQSPNSLSSYLYIFIFHSCHLYLLALRNFIVSSQQNHS